MDFLIYSLSLKKAEVWVQKSIFWIVPAVVNDASAVVKMWCEAKLSKFLILENNTFNQGVSCKSSSFNYDVEENSICSTNKINYFVDKK